MIVGQMPKPHVAMVAVCLFREAEPRMMFRSCDKYAIGAIAYEDAEEGEDAVEERTGMTGVYRLVTWSGLRRG